MRASTRPKLGSRYQLLIIVTAKLYLDPHTLQRLPHTFTYCTDLWSINTECNSTCIHTHSHAYSTRGSFTVIFLSARESPSHRLRWGIRPGRSVDRDPRCQSLPLPGPSMTYPNTIPFDKLQYSIKQWLHSCMNWKVSRQYIYYQSHHDSLFEIWKSARLATLVHSFSSLCSWKQDIFYRPPF